MSQTSMLSSPLRQDHSPSSSSFTQPRQSSTESNKPSSRQPLSLSQEEQKKESQREQNNHSTVSSPQLLQVNKNEARSTGHTTDLIATLNQPDHSWSQQCNESFRSHEIPISDQDRLKDRIIEKQKEEYPITCKKCLQRVRGFSKKSPLTREEQRRFKQMSIELKALKRKLRKYQRKNPEIVPHEDPLPEKEEEVYLQANQYLQASKKTAQIQDSALLLHNLSKMILDSQSFQDSVEFKLIYRLMKKIKREVSPPLTQKQAELINSANKAQLIRQLTGGSSLRNNSIERNIKFQELQLPPLRIQPAEEVQQQTAKLPSIFRAINPQSQKNFIPQASVSVPVHVAQTGLNPIPIQGMLLQQSPIRAQPVLSHASASPQILFLTQPQSIPVCFVPPNISQSKEEISRNFLVLK